MNKESPFSTVTRKLLDAWLSCDPASPAAAEEVYGGVLEHLSIKMRLSLYLTDGDDPLDWRLRAIRHSGFTTTLFDLNKIFADCVLRDFRDQEYLRDAVLPRVIQVMENGQPSVELVRTRLMGVKLGYERILIPQRTVGRPEWIITASNARFLLDSPKVAGKFDIGDEAVVQLLIEGCSAKEIAATLGVSRRTVEHRLERLKNRFGARNTLHLAVMLVSRHVDRRVDGRSS